MFYLDSSYSCHIFIHLSDPGCADGGAGGLCPHPFADVPWVCLRAGLHRVWADRGAAERPVHDLPPVLVSGLHVRAG